MHKRIHKNDPDAFFLCLRRIYRQNKKKLNPDFARRTFGNVFRQVVPIYLGHLHRLTFVRDAKTERFLLTFHL